MVEISGAFTSFWGGLMRRDLRMDKDSAAEGLGRDLGEIVGEEAAGWLLGVGVVDEVAGMGLRRLRGLLFASADDVTRFSNRVFWNDKFVDELGNPLTGVVRQNKHTLRVVDGIPVGVLDSSGPRTWNDFQRATLGQYATRAEAGEAWAIYKAQNGITSGVVRSSAQKKAFLRKLHESGKTPTWMNQWLQNGLVPPGYNVDHIKPLSVGGPDVPSNMRLVPVDIHVYHHSKYAPWRGGL